VALPGFRRPRYLILSAVILLLSAVPIGLYIVRRPPAPPVIPLSEFLQRVESGSVSQVALRERSIDVVFRDGTTATTTAPPEFLVGSSFVSDLVKREILVEAEHAPDPGSLSWTVLAMAAAFFGLLAFTVYRTTAGKIPSISARTRQAENGENVVTFQDVAGVDEAKD
jgi:ATP-dependent Zn protease